MSDIDIDDDIDLDIDDGDVGVDLDSDDDGVDDIDDEGVDLDSDDEGIDGDDTDAAAASKEAEKAKEKEAEKAKAEKEKKEKDEKDKKKKVPEKSHYEVLGLEKFGVNVTSENIRKSYRKQALKHHPDKNIGIPAEEVEAAFLVIKKAYETLNDVKKRRAYDSTLEFDNKIPSGTEPAADFLAVYGPVFQRNARFAVKLPVPDLGNADSSPDDVIGFYNYWMQFESWRDFTAEVAEHDVETASCREEKRWMSNENEKLAKARKKEEYGRIAKLVELAKANDRRFEAAKNSKKNAKAAARQAKVDAKAAEAAAAKAAEEAAAAEAAKAADVAKLAAKSTKAQKDYAKKALKKAKQLLRKLCSAGAAAEAEASGTPVPLSFFEDIEVLCEHLDIDELAAASALLGGSVDAVDVSGMAAVYDLIDATKSKAAGNDEAAQAALAAERAKRAAVAEAERLRQEELAKWSSEEDALLKKAVQRFPAGSMKRWGTVAEWVTTQLSLQRPRTEGECIKRWDRLRAEETQRLAPQHAKGPAAAAAPAAATAAAAEGAEAEWTAAQQKQLEEALKKNPPSMEKNERWKAVSAAVDGKTKKDCVQRFKFLRTQVQGAKA